MEINPARTHIISSSIDTTTSIIPVGNLSVSSPGKGERFEQRRRIKAGDQSVMQDGNFPMPRARIKDLALGKTLL